MRNYHTRVSATENAICVDPFIKQNEPPSRMAQLFRQMVGWMPYAFAFRPRRVVMARQSTPKPSSAKPDGSGPTRVMSPGWSEVVQ
jgi:hypothetical protein